ncbi:MAG: hypothetical protein WCJ30_06920, partial [Deltaproteobacteria bacterium]
MPSLPTCITPLEIATALPPVDPSMLAPALAQIDTRPIDYALGSGESDEVALYAGFKPLLRQVLPVERLAAARARFEALGLVVAEADHRVDLASTAGRVLFVGRDPKRVRAAVECEVAPEHDLELAQLLGYPRCCATAYLEVPAPRENMAVFARACGATRGPFEPRLNCLDLSVFHYVSWLPCAFSCALSLAYANAVAAHIALRHGQFLGRGRRQHAVCPPRCRHETFVAAIDTALAAHRLALHEDVQVSIAGRFDGHRIAVERVWPTARDRHRDVPLSGPAREATARLVRLVAASPTLSLERGVLSVASG